MSMLKSAVIETEKDREMARFQIKNVRFGKFQSDAPQLIPGVGRSGPPARRRSFALPAGFHSA